ncbi:MAG: hypothetical protein E7320_07320 [Clostridiales bacterium]|nr:hypothetical protein [Clostridiales bacterium]
MKQNMRRALLVLIAVLLQFALLASASATTITRNGLEITFTTDRESYSAGDSIVCSVDLNNTSEQELTLNYDVSLPDALEASVAERGLLVVGASEEASSSFTLHAAGKGADEVPSTGDGFPFGLVCCLFVAALAVGIGLIKGKKRFMAFILVFVLFFAVAEPLFSAPAVAEEYVDDEEHPVYEEDAYQVDLTDELSEEDEEEALLEAMLDEDEVSFKTVPAFTDEFTIQHQVYVDDQLVTIRVNATLHNDLQQETEVASKASLGKVKVTSVKVLGTVTYRFYWNAVDDATHYEVWHKNSDGTYSKVKTVTALQYYTKTGIKGKVNTYRIRAIKKSGTKTVATGAYASFTTYGMLPPEITSVKHTGSTTGDVRIRWDAVKYCTGYRVYRSYSGKTGTYSLIGTTTGTSFVDKDRNGFYKVKAYYKTSAGKTYLGSSGDKGSMAPQYRALIVGQSYPNWSSGQLPGCLTDAKGMKAMLDSSSNPNYRPIDVKLKTNLTSDDIFYWIKRSFKRAKDTDISLFYYSGHGVGTYGWLCGVNSDTSYDYVTVADLKAALDKVRGKKIVLLDSCYSGMFIDKTGNGDIMFISEKDAAALGADKAMTDQEAMEAFTNNVINVFAAAEKADNLATSKYYVMTGCSKYQTSAELISGGTRFGLFTNVLLEASGYNSPSGSFYAVQYGDADNNGKLTLKELYSYTYSGVNEIADMLGITQSVRVYPTNSSFVCWGK